MEKRFFLATLLSFVILYVWIGSQKSNILQQKEGVIQNVQKEKDEKPLREKIENNFDNIAKKTTKEQDFSKEANDFLIKEKTVTISGKKLEITFSNLGGSILKTLIKDYDEIMPLKELGSVAGYEKEYFYLVKQNQKTVEYFYEDSEISIRKKYTVSDNDYTVQSDIITIMKKKMSKQHKVRIIGLSLDMGKVKKELAKKDATAARDKSLYEYMIATPTTIIRKNKAYRFSEKDIKREQVPVEWIGFRNRYYCALVKPNFSSSAYALARTGEDVLHINIEPENIGFLNNGEERKYSFISYVGPEKIEILKKYKMGFERVKRYYKLGIFDWTAKIIRSIMFTIHKVVPNWGLCILILGVLVYFCTYPMTMKSMLAMKKMQALSPQINAMKEKYKNNPQKMNKEIMELYKENKVNPMGGCLPMFFQMPIFLGLLQVLWRAVDLKGAKFLWIKDLSAPDRLFIFSKSFPIIGNELNILPLFMIVVMFFQQKFSSKSMVALDEAQRQQQKMMSVIFPLLFGFIFYRFASGLTLYFSVYYILSTVTQYNLAKSTEGHYG